MGSQPPPLLSLSLSPSLSLPLSLSLSLSLHVLLPLSCATSVQDWVCVQMRARDFLLLRARGTSTSRATRPRIKGASKLCQASLFNCPQLLVELKITGGSFSRTQLKQVGGHCSNKKSDYFPSLQHTSVRCQVKISCMIDRVLRIYFFQKEDFSFLK
jgi:hypothetical protein